MGPAVHVAVMAQHTNFLIVKELFRSLSLINTVPVPVVLSFDTPTKMEPSIISEKYKFGSNCIVCYLQKTAIEICSSVIQ